MCKFVILLAAVVACCSVVNGSHANQCRRALGKMNFDQDKFSGEWFVVAKIMSSAAPKMVSTCNKVDMSVKTDGNITRMTSTMSVKVEGHEVKFHMKGQSSFPHVGSMMQATYKKEGDEKWMGVFSQSVLATDYEDFALMYACQPIFIDATDMFDKIELVQIMSRKPEMEHKLLDIFKIVLGGFDFDVSEMITVDNTDC